MCHVSNEGLTPAPVVWPKGVGVTDNKFMIFIMTGLLENGNCSIYLSVSIVLN